MANIQKTPAAPNSAATTTSVAAGLAVANRANAIVAVYRLDTQDDTQKLVMEVPRAKLETHSLAFRTFLSAHPVKNEQYREVTLPTGAPAALRHVLKTIVAYRGPSILFIDLRSFTTAQNIAIWEVCELLRLEPGDTQKKIAGHLSWRISHDRLTPAVMTNVYKVFRKYKDDPDRSKQSPYNSMVHQYVWEKVHSMYKPEELAELEKTAAQWPDLVQAFTDKEKTLGPKAEQHKFYTQMNMRRDAARRQEREGRRTRE